ncbi:MAG TPA: hypothetical protein VGN01_17880 [Acidobacteriaceae bacterium]|jgi:hypothetical protein
MNRFRIAVLLVPIALVAGCNKQADTTPNYKSAINAYYQAHPACLWQDEKRFPIQASPDDAKAQNLDALVDQGLLTRTTTEKKIVIVSKRENNYDLSDKGRSAWTADPSQPGYGNFCYGHRSVSTIDNASPTNAQPGATTTVAYHYTVTGVPDWASAAETQTAFPQLRAANTPQPATATLTNTTDGWQVSGAANSATPADSKIVQ